MLDANIFNQVAFVEEDRMITVEPSKREELEEDTTPKDGGSNNQKKGPGLLSVGQG